MNALEAAVVRWPKDQTGCAKIGQLLICWCYKPESQMTHFTHFSNLFSENPEFSRGKSFKLKSKVDLDAFDSYHRYKNNWQPTLWSLSLWVIRRMALFWHKTWRVHLWLKRLSTLTYGPVDRGSSFVPNDVSMCGLCTPSCQNISHITTLVAHSGPQKNLQNKNIKRKLNRAWKTCNG